MGGLLQRTGNSCTQQSSLDSWQELKSRPTFKAWCSAPKQQLSDHAEEDHTGI